MKRSAVYGAWAREGDTWRDWVKPVLFAALDDEVTPDALRAPPDWIGPRLLDPLAVASSTTAERPYRRGRAIQDAAIVVDLPGASGAKLGVALGPHGFRPVPLYNAVPAPLGTAGIVDVRPIMRVLVDAARLVEGLPQGLPPAFLLDSDRLAENRPLAPGAFDNRSVCTTSDFPSASTLLRCGLRRVVLVRTRSSMDLDPIALAWQSAGIGIWSMVLGASNAEPLVLSPRSWLTRLGDFGRHGLLRRRPDGAFGALIPHGG